MTKHSHARLCLLFALITVAIISTFASRTVAKPTSCCTGNRGNVDGKGIVDLGDLAALISYLTGAGFVPPCMDAANVDGKGIVDLGDLAMLVAYLTDAIPSLPPCPTATITYATRLAAFTALDSVQTGLSGVSPDSLANALIAFLGSRNEFEAYGKDGTTVWARFKDGRLLIIPNNRIPTDSGGTPGLSDYQAPDSIIPAGFVLPKRRFASWDPTKPSAASQVTTTASPFEIPSTVQARLISTLGSPCFTTATGKARALLSDAGYHMSPSDGTVPGLLAVQGDGLFYIDAHCGGGTDRAGNPNVWSIWTSSLVSAAGDSAYASMLDSTELVYMWAKDLNGGACSVHSRYAFTGKFVAQYMSFAKNSFVLINACSSNNPNNTSLKDGFRAAGVSVYAGWTLPVTDRASDIAGEFLVDRMLGTNKSTLTAPESPPQRPFDVSNVWGEMVSTDLNLDVSTGSLLIPDLLKDNFGLLAPSIATMFVLPYGQKLVLYGMFGSNPGSDGQVTVGGVSLPIVSWGYSGQIAMDSIVCTIPDDGAGSAGDVQVSVRSITSNTMQLSRYKGKFTLSHETGDGRKYEVTLDLQFRVDLLPFRTKPGQPPAYNQTTYVVNADMASSGVDTCSGVTNLPDGGSITWSGNDVLYNNIDGSGTPKSFIAGAWFDPEHNQMQVYLSGGVPDGITEVVTDNSGNTTTFTQSIIYGLDQFDGKNGNLPSYAQISLNPDLSIPQGSSTAKSVALSYSVLVPFGDTVKIKWDNISCDYPPSPQAPRAPEAVLKVSTK